MTVLFRSLSTTLFSRGKKIVSFMKALLRRKSNLKLGMSIAVRPEKLMESETVEALSNSPMYGVACELTVGVYMQHIDALITQLNMLAGGGSDWVAEALKQLEIETAFCNNFTGGSCVDTLPFLKTLKPSILIVVNKRDVFCFLCCIAAAMSSFVGRPHNPKIHKIILNDYLSTQSDCRCLFPPILRFRSEMNSPSMFITGKTLRWCRCITVRTGRNG